MLKYSLKLAIRKLLRDKTLTFINVTGLAIGMTCSILILLWVKNEITYDQFHANVDQIYRVELNNFREGEFEETSSITQIPIGPALEENFAEIEAFTRFRGPMELTFSIDDAFISESGIFYTDTGMFDIFSFPLIEGNPETALREPNSIVLTPNSVEKIFGQISPIGQTLVYNGSIPLQVTGIIADPPENSHIKYKGFISFSTIVPFTHCMEWDCNYSFYTYIRIHQDANMRNLEARFPDFLWEPLNKKNSNFGHREDIVLRPLRDIHLRSKSYEIERGGSMEMIFLFSAISLFIIIIACINFINLTTAQLSKRGTEIGVKKVAGASRSQLALQIFGEILFQAILSLIIAVIIIELTLPAFNTVLGKSLEMTYSDVTLLSGLAIILGTSVFLSGTYPALVLTSLNPSQVMKKDFKSGENKSVFRNSLVVVQFVISISLIASTMVVYNQLEFIQTLDIGFQKENVLTFTLGNEEARGQYENLLNEIKSLPQVINAGASTEVPGNGFTSNGYVPEGVESPIMFNALDIDEHFIETMGMNIIQGRNFSNEVGSDKEACLVNESLVKLLDWGEPLGKIIERNGTNYKIIGVIKDFHFTSAHSEVTPLLISNVPWRGVQGFGRFSVRIHPGNIPQTVAKIENIWKSRVTSIPFEYTFMDERFDRLYQSERVLGKLFIYFTVLAILISSLGVFGLILFMIEQRTKEISIRKVLGASIMQLVYIFSSVFSKRILLALLLAVPTTLLMMNSWLQNFAFKTKITPMVFFLAGGLALMITLITVGFHSIKAATRNPAEVLKYE